MSIYFSSLFVLLVAEMSIMFVLVMPLHYQVRKRIVATSDKFLGSSQVRTVIAIVSCLVLLLFVDSWKRASVPVSSQSYSPSHGHGHGLGSASGLASHDPAATTSTRSLASRAYNQRNVYISGFILYFTLCIPVLLNLLSRLVKYETLLRELNSRPTSEEDLIRKQKGDDPELSELKNQLESKKKSLKALQTQVDNLNKHFDSNNEPKQDKPVSGKKDD
ncbi:endoplasmic reticulum transmembrane protein 1 [Kluyveromyces marxianus]|uniref:Endoplasmic reticulum transmembrane protein n=1 Tax=Kluyveromyces marxianus TaxID=4911 RepID=A0ABX6EYW7_KLUMA|nr:endoplasmic reticulum transmembrane protein 1 [Kluyveromyces marxianus]